MTLNNYFSVPDIEVPSMDPCTAAVTAVEATSDAQLSEIIPEPSIAAVSETAPERPGEAVAEVVDPAELLARGKREQLCGETQKAVSLFQEACRLL